VWMLVAWQCGQQVGASSSVSGWEDGGMVGGDGVGIVGMGRGAGIDGVLMGFVDRK
jgi:hypothetical protein